MTLDPTQDPVDALIRMLDLADGLNRLTDNAYLALYPRLGSLEARLEKALGERARSPRRLWLDLDQVTPDMRQQVGGKAFPLGGLIRAGLPVPEGVCLTRRACRYYLRQTRLEERLQAIMRQGVTPEADLAALSAIATLGADFVSVGRITHSAPSADFSMLLKETTAP